MASSRAEAGVIDEGLRAYMLRVYNYMASGLAVTGVVAFTMAALAVSSPAFAQAVYGSPLMWVIILAPLGMVLYLSARIGTMSVPGAQTAFWIFAALMGASLSSIFLVYTGIVDRAGILHHRGLLRRAESVRLHDPEGPVGLGLVPVHGPDRRHHRDHRQPVPRLTALMFAISVIGVLVFAGLTAYDTQQIKQMYYAGDDGTVAGRKAIMGALRLYLDFINMFIMLLHLFGGRE
jgi:uncharacterized protein